MSLYPDPYNLRRPRYPEFNTGGDQGTGTVGSNTPSSVTNARNQSQPARVSDNPFTAMLDHVNNFNAATQSGGKVPSTPLNPGAPAAPLNPGAPAMTPSWPSQGPLWPSQGPNFPVTTMPVPTTPPTSSTQAGFAEGGYYPTGGTSFPSGPKQGGYGMPEVEIQPQSAYAREAPTGKIPSPTGPIESPGGYNPPQNPGAGGIPLPDYGGTKPVYQPPREPLPDVFGYNPPQHPGAGGIPFPDASSGKPTQPPGPPTSPFGYNPPQGGGAKVPFPTAPGPLQQGTPPASPVATPGMPTGPFIPTPPPPPPNGGRGGLDIKGSGVPYGGPQPGKPVEPAGPAPPVFGYNPQQPGHGGSAFPQAFSVSAQSAALPGNETPGGPINQPPPENPLPGGGPGTSPPPPAGTTPPPGTTSPPDGTSVPMPPEGAPPPPPSGTGRARPTAPVTQQNDWLHHDTDGTPWSATHPPPRPPNTEDENVAARWYAQHNYLEPTLVQVTGEDVGHYRTSGYQPTYNELAAANGNAFIAWWKAGKPMPAQAPPPATAPPPGGGWTPPPPPDDSNRGGGVVGTGQGATPPVRTGPRGEPLPPEPPAPPPPASGTPPTGTPPSTPPPPVTSGGPPATPAPTAPPSDEINRLIDLYTQGQAGAQSPGIESRLNPMFRRQRQNVIADLNASAASTPGRLQSGGFEANKGEAVAGLASQQSGQLAEAMSAEYLAKLQQETKYKELATQAGMQKYITDINADLTRLGITTNDALQRYLSSEDNALKRYGIDSNDVLQRYLANLQLEGTKYSADAGVSAASLHAAAAQSAASAAAGAGMYGADLQYKLGMARLGVDRESNIGQFILGIMGLGITNLNDLNGILAGIPTGSIVVNP